MCIVCIHLIQLYETQEKSIHLRIKTQICVFQGPDTPQAEGRAIAEWEIAKGKFGDNNMLVLSAVATQMKTFLSILRTVYLICVCLLYVNYTLLKCYSFFNQGGV